VLHREAIMHLKKRGVEAILVRVFEFRGECTSCVSVKTSYFEKIGASNWTPKTISSAARKSSALLYPDGPIHVLRRDTVVLGLGFPTLVPKQGNVSMTVASVPGVKLSGLIFDAGLINSPVLLKVGQGAGTDGGLSNLASQQSDPNDPTLIQDVFFRIGGETETPLLRTFW
jgi:hypothetical protein